MLAPLSRDTLTQQATDTIRRFIATEDLNNGDQLPSERELSENLAVSRNIVREALSVLVAQGMITKKPGRGIFVADAEAAHNGHQGAVTVGYDGNSLSALSEARAVVELGAIALMAQRITHEQIEQLQTINHALADNLHHHRSTIKADIEFHKVLIQSTHNQVLTDMIPLLVEHFRQAVLHRPEAIFNNPERVITEHQAIIQALKARDALAARQALLNHLHLDGFPG